MNFARQRWRIAAQVVIAVRVLLHFKTLRDMHATAQLPLEQMEFVCHLGEGAFGKVEKRQLLLPDGSRAYFAVKRLKQQNVRPEALVANPAGSQVDIAAVLLRLDSNAAERRALHHSTSAKRASADSIYELRSCPEGVQSASGRGEHDSAPGEGLPPSPKRQLHSHSSGFLRKGSHAHSVPEDMPVQDLLDGDDGAELESLIYAMSEDDQLFLKEINLMRCLSHPHIIRYLGCGVIQGKDGAHISIAQELCAGGSIKDMIATAALKVRSKRLYNYSDAKRWSIQVAGALAYLHTANPQVLHRDLKAENLLLTNSGRAGDIRVMDFGLTKLRRIAKLGYSQALKEDQALAQPYTMTGKTGSFCYMAPEVLRGQHYTEKVDIFSFGVIMFELFSMNLVSLLNHRTGHPAEFEQYARRVAGGYRETLKDTWPAQLRALIAQCWAADAAQRPSADDIAVRLRDMGDAIDAWDGKNSRGVVKAIIPVQSLARPSIPVDRQAHRAIGAKFSTEKEQSGHASAAASTAQTCCTIC